MVQDTIDRLPGDTSVVADTGLAAPADTLEAEPDRPDFPERDDANWLANIFATHKEGVLALRKGWVAEATGWEDRPGDIRIKPWG